MGTRRHGLRASVRAQTPRPDSLAVPETDPFRSGPDHQQIMGGRLGQDAAGFVRVSREVPLARAMELLRGGAGLVIDPCGCGGFCGFDWVGSQELDRVRGIGDTRWRRLLRRSAIEEWRSADDQVLLLLHDVSLDDL